MKSIRVPLYASVGIIVVLGFISVVTGFGNNSKDGNLSVVFFDVGQGDATFIESPQGVKVLIDGGRDGMILGELTKEIGFFNREIDMIIITHPDLDHIGGLIDVLKKYKVDTIVMTENVSETEHYKLLKEEIFKEGADIIFARRGQVFDLGFGVNGTTTLTILFPDRDPTYLESNTSSIVARLVYGESEFIFTGDSPRSIEEYLVSAGSTELQSDVFKVGHHGSKTSSSEAFVTAVSPNLAIISASKNNSYGHPHKEVTDMLSSYGITYKNTADYGSIRLVSDGEEIWVR